MDDLLLLDRQNIWHPFTQLESSAEIPLVNRAEGVHIYTADGRQIIDAISSWWVNLHGHCNETIAQAVADQTRKLEHVIFAGFTHEPAIELSRNILDMLGSSFKRVFFSDNGSTAVEVAIKMAIQYWHNRGEPKKKIIAIKGGYHGDTFGSMSVAERGLFTAPFSPFLFDTAFIDFPVTGSEQRVVEQFKKLAKGRDVAAFIFEPLVQAAGGMRMYAPSCLDQLMGYAKENNIICIADEVFTGFGRTGKNLAVNYLSGVPDIIALSKGITGGFMPLGLTACSGEIIEAFNSSSLDKTFFHGHSYTANPLACAAANASYRLLADDKCQQRIKEISQLHRDFAQSIDGHKSIREARTLGTILAIELKTEEETSYQNSVRSTIYPYFLERNILLRPLGNVVYVLPPYVIKKEELWHIYTTIKEFLDRLQQKKG